MRNSYQETKKAWSGLSIYQRFEQIIALVLTLLVSIVIIVATWNLFRTILTLVLEGVIEPSRPEVFQKIFGMAMIMLIALEFNYTLVSVVERGRSIIQVRTVILIALLAVLRKFIVIEVGETEASLLIALSIAALALGIILRILSGPDRADEWDAPRILSQSKDQDQTAIRDSV